MDRRKITAFLIDCEPEDFLAYKDYADYGIAVVAKDGKKYTFTAKQLGQAEIAMQQTTTLAEAAASKPKPRGSGTRPASRQSRAGSAKKKPARRTTKKVNGK